jgi:1,4-alpha-glucan branching enzyme
MVIQPSSLLSDQDLYLFNEGSHLRLWERLGAHPGQHDGVPGVYFGVWAPNATTVSVFGDFNAWDPESHRLLPLGTSGIWVGFVPGVGRGDRYKYHVVSRFGEYRIEKADPFALYGEVPPLTASKVWTLEYDWSDEEWMRKRSQREVSRQPMAIYEVHIGSWRRVPEEGDRAPGYRELAKALPEYVVSQGFTHVEFLPVMEHPFYGSWGYQTTGYFAPSSRYGTPQDLMFLIDALHQAGIGVILDWVPSHFPGDGHGLGFFDGTHLYEHGDPRQGVHPDWASLIFNYGRHEVRSFLLSSALFWLERYHADGLRVDAVASMLYLDYSRKPGEWIPNSHGGRENLEAISFVHRINEEAYGRHPGIVTIAEESTDWPSVTRPSYLGGLGFGMKWDMGWMHDTLAYMAQDPIYRRFHHQELTFRMIYAWSENFILALSHDEVVYGKGSLLAKMPGDDWQKFANLRLLYGYMYTQPGKKLLFMGGEFGQWREWSHERSLDWHLLEYSPHRFLQRYVRDLNTCYRGERALHEADFDAGGFEWIDCHDADQSTLSYLRRGRTTQELLVVACNFTPVPRHDFRIGVPRAGQWIEILNSDAPLYGGSGQGNLGRVVATPVSWHGREYSLNVTLPPLGILIFKSSQAGSALGSGR